MKTPIHSFLFGCLILFGLLTAQACAAQDPAQTLRSVVTQVMTELRQHRAELQREPKKIFEVVNRVIIPHMDFEEMARWVAGRNAWRTADKKTQQDFVRLLQTLVVKTYANALLEYKDQEIVFLPVRGQSDQKDRVQVSTLIQQDDRGPLHIDYNLIRSGNAWRVYDIMIEGVSLIQGYRAQFADDIRHSGLTAGLEKLRERISEKK